METIRFIRWEEQGGWLGYLEEYPDYWTQGDTLEDLKEHLRDLYRELTSGEMYNENGAGCQSYQPSWLQEPQAEFHCVLDSLKITR